VMALGGSWLGLLGCGLHRWLALLRRGSGLHRWLALLMCGLLRWLAHPSKFGFRQGVEM